MPEQQEPLACRILRTLAEAAAQQAQTAQAPSGSATAGLSVPRLGKRLGQSASVLLRELTYLSDAVLAGQRGPGWVRVAQEEGRWVAHITAEGLAVAHGLAAETGTRPVHGSSAGASSRAG